MKKGDSIFNLGQMHLNKLRDIKRIKGERFKLSAVGEEDDTSDDEDSDDENNDIGAFDIDSKTKDGRLALLFRDPKAKPQIWF